MYNNLHISQLPNFTFIGICSIFKCPMGGANKIGLTLNLMCHHRLIPSRMKCHAEHFFSRKGKINTPQCGCRGLYLDQNKCFYRSLGTEYIIYYGCMVTFQQADTENNILDIFWLMISKSIKISIYHSMQNKFLHMNNNPST